MISLIGLGNAKVNAVALTAALVAGLAAAGCLQQGGEVKTSCEGDATEAAAVGGYEALSRGSTIEGRAAMLQSLALDDQQADEPLKIGTLMPLTGSLQTFGPNMERATKLAAMHINEAGGVLGNEIELVHGDTRTDSTQAPNGFQNLVNQDVAAVVGAASSGVTGSVIELAVQNEIVLVTPASTSPALTNRDNDGFFYRIPPNDALQGKVLADLVYDDGCRSASILAVNNDYGVGLGDVFKSAFEGKGGTVPQYVKFEEGGTTFASQVEQAARGEPDAIVFVGYPAEGTQVIKEAFQKGIMANSVIFFSEGVNDPEFVQDVGQDADGNWILAGLRGTTPQSLETAAYADFAAAHEAEYGATPTLFTAESYDAVWAIALASAHAGETSGDGFKGSMRTVWNAPGTKVSASDGTQAFATAELGQDIDYQGAANDFDWDDRGDPTTGVYAYWQVQSDGTIQNTQEDLTPE